MAEGTETTPHTYPQGVPCWIEEILPDPQRATEFYGRLFGWEFENRTPPGASGVFLIATRNGKAVGSLSSGDGARWVTYIAVDDLDAMTRRAVGAGATLLVEPVTAGPARRWAELRDPRG